ncbi:hypothetical protein V1520DRAFT_355077 [Lipomyces starkeyi]
MSGSSTELGICPQRNVMWDDLTVEEHVRIWDKIMAARRATKKDVAELVRACDLK